jgi:hypothetical protein
MSSFGDCHRTDVPNLNPKNELRPRVASDTATQPARTSTRWCIAQASYAKQFHSVKHRCAGKLRRVKHFSGTVLGDQALSQTHAASTPANQ